MGGRNFEWREGLRQVGVALRRDSYPFVPLAEKDHDPMDVAEARGEFTEQLYPKLFGDEEMGDPAREFTPSEVTAVLAAYESHLAVKGLLRIKESK